MEIETVPKRRFPDPFFYFDKDNGSSDPSPPEESILAFLRRLSTRDGESLRCLLNGCLARYTDRDKQEEMKSSLELGSDRQQFGVLTELLVSEIMHVLAPQIEIEPGHRRGPRPDFRIYDADGNAAIVEVTHFMDSSDEDHASGQAWSRVVHRLRDLVRPIPAYVHACPNGEPREIEFDSHQESTIHGVIGRSWRSGRSETVQFGTGFSVTFRVTPRFGGGRGILLAKDYEHPDGIVNMQGKLRRILDIVEGKAGKYTKFQEPLFVVVNCPTAFLWLDEEDELTPLASMLEGVPCDAIWLFENLKPWNLGFCKSHLILNPSTPNSKCLDLLRSAMARPLHEVLGLGPEWSRPVGFGN